MLHVFSDSQPPAPARHLSSFILPRAGWHFCFFPFLLQHGLSEIPAARGNFRDASLMLRRGPSACGPTGFALRRKTARAICGSTFLRWLSLRRFVSLAWLDGARETDGVSTSKAAGDLFSGCPFL